MRIYFTRDSVCAGDDGDAPHARQLDAPDDLALDQLIRTVLHAAPLPSIQGGLATWCVSSGVPIAVLAQQWPESRFLSVIPPKPSELDIRGGTLCLHFSYFAQQEPETVVAVLARLRVRVE